MNVEELILRAECGEVVGDGSVQIKTLVAQKAWCFERLKKLQEAQATMRDPERQVVCEILANGYAKTKPSEPSDVCGWSISSGNACGTCQKCKAEAWDWLCKNSTALDEYAVFRIGQHNPMKAVIHSAIEMSKR